MELVYLLIFVIAIFIVLLFIIALRVKLVFNSDKADINMTLLWLDPFIKAFVTIENAKPVLKLYIFNNIVLERTLNRGKNNHKDLKLIQLTNPKDIHVNVHYGFRDPFTTGIACGAINVASQFIDIDSIYQIPDFTTENDYIYLDATAKLNLGSTLIRLLSSKSSS